MIVKRFFLVSTLFFFSFVAIYGETVNLLIPAVKEATLKGEMSSLLFEKPVIEVDDDGGEAAYHAAKWLSQFTQSGVITKPKNQFSPNQTIQFHFLKKPFQKKEGEYHLEITPQIILVISNSNTGFFNATATLIQFYQLDKTKKKTQSIIIDDYPDFPIRGFMHDVGRNFQTIKKLKENIDIFAQYKINLFHWHLTDNPAWRIESKRYPQLNEAKNHRALRNAGAFYTFDEIRELFSYAKAKGIQILPEIDMPGHSKYFNRTFGTSMNSPKGMKILEELIDEFCEAIPQEMAPLIHIGSDEVHIINKQSFMNRIIAAIKKNNREIVSWHPGLTPTEKTILQIWDRANFVKGWKNIDSSTYYIASVDPLLCLKEICQNPICGSDFSYDPDYTKANPFALGAISCVWNDVRVANEEEIYTNNPVYSATIMMAQRAWNNRCFHYVGAPTLNMDSDLFTKAAHNRKAREEQYAQMESRLKAHRDQIFTPAKIPFFFIEQSPAKWKFSSIQLSEQELKKITSDQDYYEKIGKNWNFATGMVVNLKGRWREQGMVADKPVGTGVVLATRIYSPKTQKISLLAGFEVPLRPNRQYAGIPSQGEWSVDGSLIYLNGEKIQPPVWEKPNRYAHSQSATWHKSEEEIPWTKEEFYWTRKPVQVQLQEGWNFICISTQLGYEKQFWVSAFIPIDLNSCTENIINPVEIPGLKYNP